MDVPESQPLVLMLVSIDGGDEAMQWGAPRATSVDPPWSGP